MVQVPLKHQWNQSAKRRECVPAVLSLWYRLTAAGGGPLPHWPLSIESGRWRGLPG